MEGSDSLEGFSQGALLKAVSSLSKENANSILQNLRNLLIKIVPAFTPENKINDILHVNKIN
jgi:hypothetical protein